MAMMFVGGVVLMLDGILVLFLLLETYGAGVFCSRPKGFVTTRTQIVVKLLSNTKVLSTTH